MTTVGESPEIKDTVPWKRVRYVMTFMSSFMILTAMATRNTLSIAIVAMTNNSTNSNAETFDWDGTTQGNILSAFFWGYTATTLFSSVLITRFGTRNILLSAFSLNTVATASMPVAAYSGWGALCGLRVVQGISQCCLLPAVVTIMSKWLVPSERELLGSLIWTGGPLGILISMGLSGVIASRSWGWPAIFYVFGCVSLVWSLLWFLVGYDSPADHSFITKEEKAYIESFYSADLNAKSFQVPWRAIFTSIPAWGSWLAQLTHTWGFYIIMSEMPTYMNDVLQFDITKNGLLMALPYVAQLVFTFIFGGVSKAMQTRDILSVQQRRQLFNTISMFSPVPAFLTMGFIGVNEKEVVVTMVIVLSGLLAGTSVGYQLSQLELAPRFSSVVNGVGSTFSYLITIILPISVSKIVQTKGSESQWHIVFFISSAMYLFGTIIFYVTVPIETQSWNELPVDSEKGTAE